MVYEFEVEVRPEFPLPVYRGLRLRRPVKTYTDADVSEAERRLLAPNGQIVPKEGGAVDVGDVVVADVTVRDGDRVLGTLKETSFRVEKQLLFRDGMARKFAEQMKGARAGETRLVDVELSSQAAQSAGKVVQATFEVKDVKALRLPEKTPEFLEAFGVHSAEQFRELLRVMLERNLEHQQRRAARAQVAQQIAASSKWELPEDLLLRQARSALARRVMEMKSDGISEEEIAKQRRLLEQNILQSTSVALKEHFVLQKIAEVEKIKIDEGDIDDEIERIAEQSDESPRRVRARLEKEGMMDALAAEMIERKALDLILDAAEYEEVPLDPEATAPVAEVDAQAVPGAMRDPAAEAEAHAAQAAQAAAEVPPPS
jgi:trigger factor